MSRKGPVSHAVLGGLTSLLVETMLFFGLPLALPSEQAVASYHGISPATAEKLQIFLDRFAAFNPNRKVTYHIESGPCPPGFILIKYETDFSAPAFAASSALLLSEDARFVFVGHALPLGDSSVKGRDPQGPKKLSRFFSTKAGNSMHVCWDWNPGPGGTFVATVTLQSPLGPVQRPGALSEDGRWFLFGAFFPLNQDPRRVRMARLGLKSRPVLGPPEATVTLVEISDYQCPECADLQPLLEEELAKHSRRLKLVRVDNPQWQAHDWAMKAAAWSRCVGQDAPRAYWDFATAIFFRQRDLTSSNFDSLMGPVAEGLAIPPAVLGSCLGRGSGAKAVLDDLNRVASIGLSGTPALLVNGVLMGRSTATDLDAAIERAISSEYRP